MTGASDSPSISVDTLDRWEDAIPLTDSLARASVVSGASESVSVDFTRTPQGDHPPLGGLVLANALARFQDVELEVTLPDDRARLQMLARAGVCFALARRGNIQFRSPSAGSAQLLLKQWKRNWMPRDVQQPMFDFGPHQDVPGHSPSTMEHRIVAFLNPVGMSSVKRNQDQGAVVYPWLYDLFGKDKRGRSRLSEELYHDISLASSELLDNVAHHARIKRSDLCSYSIFRTGKHLNLTVMDTGAGMLATIPEKLDDDSMSPEGMVSAAFNGKLPRRERDRGRGLHRLTEIARRTMGHLYMITGSADVEGSIAVDYYGSAPEVAAKRIPSVNMRGTSVMLRIPVSGMSKRNRELDSVDRSPTSEE